MERNKLDKVNGRRGVKQVGALIGAGVLTAALGGCGLLEDTSKSPGARHALTEEGREVLGLGEQAAKDYRFGPGVYHGVHTTDDGVVLSQSFTHLNSQTGLLENYEDDITHKPGALKDNKLSDIEIDNVECKIKSVVQLPSGAHEVLADSTRERNSNGKWISRIITNNMDGPLDACSLVLSALPGASDKK